MELYDYQKEDLAFLSQWGRSANFSKPGVGKTPVAVRLIQEINGLPCLIVCPNNARYYWEDTIQSFWQGEPPSVKQYEGSPAKRRNIENYDILITTYDTFRIDFKHYFQKRTFQMAIFDEAHRLKNRKAQVTKCAYKLNAKFIHLITGTPVVKEFDDLFSYLHLLFPEQFKSYWAFVNEFGEFHFNGFGHQLVGLKPHKLPKLKNIIRQFSVRRTKEEVLPHLPPKTYKDLWLPLSKNQQKIYDEFKTFMMAELNNEVVEAQNVATQLLRLRQIALTPSLVGLPNEESSKLDALIELLMDERIPAGKQTVIMTEFRQWVDFIEPRLKEKGITVIRITGQETAKEKRANQQAFQEGKAQVALCTIKAAGTSIDLSAADMVIFTDLSWSDVDNTQAEDRVHRASQTKQVQVVRLFAKDTVDHVVLDRTLYKALTAKKILDESTKKVLYDLLTRPS